MAKKAKFSKLSIDDRLTIQGMLERRNSIRQIARATGMSRSTVYRELELNCSREPGRNGRHPTCRARVCNRCSKRDICWNDKAFYRAEEADAMARHRRSDQRKGTKLSAEEVSILDKAVTDGVRKGQSLHHIFAANPEVSAICCENTLRNLMADGMFEAKVHELRRYARFAHAKKAANLPYAKGRDRALLVNRIYADYLEYVKANPGKIVSQFDSVVGKIADGRAVLTVTFPAFGFQFGRLVDKGSAKSAADAMRAIFRRIGPGLSAKAFGIMLTDNGTEFSDFWKLEFDASGVQVRRTFYARPHRSDDKGCCERLHELFRYFVPKGKTLDRLTQADLDWMFSNIDSMPRKSLGDKTPYRMVLGALGKGFLDAIGIKEIDPRDVILRIDLKPNKDEG